MRLRVTITFYEEHETGDRPWPTVADELREKIADDPAGHLDSAAFERSNLSVTVNPT